MTPRHLPIGTIRFGISIFLNSLALPDGFRITTTSWRGSEPHYFVPSPESVVSVTIPGPRNNLFPQNYLFANLVSWSHWHFVHECEHYALQSVQKAIYHSPKQRSNEFRNTDTTTLGDEKSVYFWQIERKSSSFPPSICGRYSSLALAHITKRKH